ncbi:MAG: hypothetical protein QME47_08100, partial [Candidatus Thermoplasmatota archaeon]|nr:hypothetical protein [Candidatus Thermoplasmatota archaeon]
MNDSSLYVAWCDERDGGYTEIYYKYSNSYGNDWSDNFRLTFADDRSNQPKIVERNGLLHLVWQDKRTGNYEVFYKRSPDFASNIALTTAPNILTADGLSTSIITATVT